jgi:hypothetical protein
MVGFHLDAVDMDVMLIGATVRQGYLGVIAEKVIGDVKERAWEKHRSSASQLFRHA